MPPPLTPLRLRTLRPRAQVFFACSNPTRSRRSYAAQNKPEELTKAPAGEKGPNTQQQEHVSEEAAKTAAIEGREGPDASVGTPVQEIMAKERDTRQDAPQVLKDQVKKGDTGTSTKASTHPGGAARSFSTYARRQQLDTHSTSSGDLQLDPMILPPTNTASTGLATDSMQPGHKFPLPTLPLPPTKHKDHRHEEIVMQLTNLLMRDGKKAAAERNMALILSHLRTAPAPTYNRARGILPGAPPASHLPLNPVLYLTVAVDSVAPLIRIRSQRGAAGGGVALQIPVPLAVRQRRRQAFTWILDSAEKRANRGSGREMFAQRVAGEIISVVEGRSSVWEKRNAVHRLGMVGRSNLNFGSRGRRR